MPEQDLHPAPGKGAKSHQNRKKIARNQGREPVTHRRIGNPQWVTPAGAMRSKARSPRSRINSYDQGPIKLRSRRWASSRG